MNSSLSGSVSMFAGYSLALLASLIFLIIFQLSSSVAIVRSTFLSLEFLFHICTFLFLYSIRKLFLFVSASCASLLPLDARTLYFQCANLCCFLIFRVLLVIPLRRVSLMLFPWLLELWPCITRTCFRCRGTLVS